MIRNLFIKNSISKEHLNQNILRKFTKNLKPVLKKIKKEIYLPNKTLNILNEKFKINFNLKDLKRFKKFQTIALIGMGGSILGTEALHNSLFDKIKKKFIFLIILMKIKFLVLKKENFSKILFIVISKSGNTVETLSNVFALNILKKNSKNIIIISEKK